MKKNIVIAIAIIMCSVILPANVFAASISASSARSISAKDTATIGVYLNTEGQMINTIDGTVSLSDTHGGNFEVKELSLAQSQVDLWTRKPSLDDSNTISFVGGIPGGITGEKLLLFTVIVKINDSGTFTVSPKNINVFLHDGLGTSLAVEKNSSTITVGAPKENVYDAWKEIVSNDNNAPKPFTIEMVQDPNLYEGKKFLSFETTDDESGIWYYEVKEGNNPPVRTGNHYVLINQKSNLDITVTAYDKAGNFQVAVFSQSYPINWVRLGIALIVVCIIYGVYVIRRKKRNVQTVV